MPALGLYSVESPLSKAQAYMGSASETLASMTKSQRTEQDKPKKTAGGVLSASLGGAAAGMAMTGGNPYGGAGGAVLGGLAYYLS